MLIIEGQQVKDFKKSKFGEGIIWNGRFYNRNEIFESGEFVEFKTLETTLLNDNPRNPETKAVIFKDGKYYDGVIKWIDSGGVFFNYGNERMTILYSSNAQVCLKS